MYAPFNRREVSTGITDNATVKRLPVFLIVSILVSTTIHAQIPNGGFEEWTTQGGIEIPGAPWVTNNLAEKPGDVTYNPVTKSTDHYPVTIGNYSIRMENNISFESEEGELLPYWACSYGYSTTALYPGYNGPVFPVNGHPVSLCGYYKFLPQNNDTMVISIALYNEGTMVSSATLSGSSAVPDWTSFTLALPEYTVADSAQVGFSAFYTELGLLPSGPHGNSILYVDNLSFDNLITYTSEQISDNRTLLLYPNPASDIITLNIENTNISELTVNIYNLVGSLIRTELLEYNSRLIHVGNLYNGVYLVEIKSGDLTKIERLIIQK